jgi:ParB/RepB/Spo0J family partition protein
VPNAVVRFPSRRESLAAQTVEIGEPAATASRSSPGSGRYRAAVAAKLRAVPAPLREADGDALSLAVAENVIRADLNPLEEARAYGRLVDEHGDAAKVAKLVGKREKLIGERLDLLRLPEQADAALRAPAAARVRADACPDRGGRAAAC